MFFVRIIALKERFFKFFFRLFSDITGQHHNNRDDCRQPYSIPVEVIENLTRRLESLSRNMEVLKASQREQLSILTILMNNTAPPEPQMDNLAQDFGFPLEKVEQFRRMERRLREEETRIKLVRIQKNYTLSLQRYFILFYCIVEFLPIWNWWEHRKCCWTYFEENHDIQTWK